MICMRSSPDAFAQFRLSISSPVALSAARTFMSVTFLTEVGLFILIGMLWRDLGNAQPMRMV